MQMMMTALWHVPTVFPARDAITLHGIIDDRQDLEPWVQSKIAQAAQGIDAVPLH